MSKPKKSAAIGKQVVYNPNGADLSVRPKNSAVPAIVVEETEAGVTLNVFTSAGVQVKTNVPAKADAKKGEAYWE